MSETTVYAMDMPNAFKLKLFSKCMDSLLICHSLTNLQGEVSLTMLTYLSRTVFQIRGPNQILAYCTNTSRLRIDFKVSLLNLQRIAKDLHTCFCVIHASFTIFFSYSSASLPASYVPKYENND